MLGEQPVQELTPVYGATLLQWAGGRCTVGPATAKAGSRRCCSSEESSMVGLSSMVVLLGKGQGETFDGGYLEEKPSHE